MPIGHRRQQCEGLGKNPDRAPRIGIRESRASELADTQMIMLMGVRVEGGFEPAQAPDPAELGEDQRYKMIPALERFVIGIAIKPLHNRAKLPPIDRFKKAAKDAIAV